MKVFELAVVCFAAGLGLAQSFRSPSPLAVRSHRMVRFARRPHASSVEERSFDPLGLAAADTEGLLGPRADMLKASSAMAAVATLLTVPGEAVAKGGEYGILEGRIISLAHPVVMGFCFMVSLGAAYTGVQWRRIRDLQTEANDLKTALQSPRSALERLEAADPESLSAADTMKMTTLKSEIQMLEANLNEKMDTRKKLLSMNFRDRHWALGSLLLGLGVSFAIEGPVNTFMRAGKLFPGPHLYVGLAFSTYAGATCTALWALAAAMVPDMQKGKDWARTSHIALNVISTTLFAYYQIPTGLQIASKVIEKTTFP